MYLGDFNGNTCEVSADSPNGSVCITGLSGSGKTSRLNKMELAGANDGAAIVVLDINQTHKLEQIFRPICTEYMLKMNIIDVLKDGLGNGLLTAMKTKEGKEETWVSLVNSAVQNLGSLQRMGAKQKSVLRRAVIYAIRHSGQYDSESDALQAGLKLEDDEDTAKVVQENLWTLLNCGALKKSEKQIEAGRINIFGINGIDMPTRVVLAEIILANIWRRISFGDLNITRHGLIIVMDEFQNYSFRNDSALKALLCEGRKFKVQIVLATQTLEVFPANIRTLVNQSATHLYFRPTESEAKKIARDSRVQDKVKLEKTLKRLKVGESIAVGDLMVKDRIIRRPILLK